MEAIGLHSSAVKNVFVIPYTPGQRFCWHWRDRNEYMTDNEYIYAGSLAGSLSSARRYNCGPAFCGLHRNSAD
eukprot:1652966-Pyramimonas_sp.AAC.1